MATIRKIDRKKGTVYRVEVFYKGTRKSGNFDTRQEAMIWAGQVEKGLRHGGYFGDEPAGDLLFKNATRRYETEILPHKKPNTRDRERYMLNRLDAFFGDRLLSQIDTAMAAEYRNMRAKQVKKDTYLREFNVLSDLFNVARAEWNCTGLVNPVKELKLPAKSRGRIRFATELEARRLIEACCGSKNEKLLAYVLQQLHTGMRPSEGAGIRWRHYDLDNQAVELPETKTTQRWVPVTPVVIEQVAKLKTDGCRPDDYVYLPATVSAYVRMRPNQYFKRAFGNACSLAGLQDFTMHDLRHTAASHMLMAGVDLRTIMEIIGHSTLQMLAKYTHLATEHKRTAVERISGLGL